MKYILRFDEINKNNIAEVGGKGANLGELSKAGFNVPEGFCINTSFYTDFIEKSDVIQSINKLNTLSDVQIIKEYAKQIREEIIALKINDELKEEIRTVLSEFKENQSFAIRSSATAEDLKNASFAGQQDTYLNIYGYDEIIEAIKKGYASLFTERAVLYRNKNNIPHNTVRMSVIIQRMIPAEISGITFSADPISGNRNIINIDAGIGLGEALVSGIISPDNYKYDKEKKEIIKKNIAIKEKAIFPDNHGGTHVKQLPEETRNKEILDDYLEELVEITIKLENHYNSPQDIEWCIFENKIYILQSRPITSLFPIPDPIVNDEELHAYLSVNHIQVMTEPVSPLGLDIFRNLITFNKESRLNSDYHITPTAAGRVYLDINQIIAHKRFRKSLLNVLDGMDKTISDSIKSFIIKTDFDSSHHQKVIIKPGTIFAGIKLFLKAFYTLLFKNNSNSVETMNKFIENHLLEIEKQANEVSSTRELLHFINGLPSFVQQFAPNILPVIGSGMLSLKLLERIEKKEFGEIIYTPHLSKGLIGNVTTKMGLQIGDLADAVRESHNLKKEFSDPDYQSLIERINQLDNHQDFKNKFNNFIENYGFRTSKEIDIANLRWYENPEPLARNIMTIVNTSTTNIHRVEYQQVVTEAELKAEEFIELIRKNNGYLKSRLVKRLIKTLRNNMPLREHHKYALMKQLMIIKKMLLKEGELLVKENQIDSKEDIFWLNMRDLYHNLDHKQDLRLLISERRDNYKHYENLNPPRLICSNGEIIIPLKKDIDLPDNALTGLAVSPGITKGIAKVILDPNTETVEKGEILVTKFTDPGWTPLFINASAVVMEVGGQLTHGSVVAREYGIPAVASVDNACTLIKTGQKITVDGNNGIVTISED